MNILKSYSTYLLLIISMLLLIIYFLFGLQFIYIEGNSMSPTLQNGSWVLVDKTHVYWRRINIGDIVLLLNNENRFIVKRIALKGRIKLIWQDDSSLYIPLYNTYVYIQPEMRTVLKQSENLEINQFFILGDNTSISYDSRSYGIISKNQIIGKVINL